jgi:Zn/Cd-binding protein ZinT
MKSVDELKQAELEELRSRWYYQHLDDGSLDEVMGKEINDETEIPMDIIKEYYSDTFFVEEDFFCNI